MFTRNYDMMRFLALGVNTDCSTLESSVGSSNHWFMKNTSGNLGYNISGWRDWASYFFFTQNSSPLRYWNWDSGSCYITFGTSSTAESYDDYQLSGFNSTTFSRTVNHILHESEHYVELVSEGSYLNSSGSDQTINEIGVVFSSYEYLIYRKKLDSPFTVPNNAYFKIKMTMNIPIPTSLQS